MFDFPLNLATNVGAFGGLWPIVKPRLVRHHRKFELRSVSIAPQTVHSNIFHMGRYFKLRLLFGV